jgi:hypothetical protein
MSTKSVILLIILLLIIISGIGVTVWRFSQNASQDLTPEAQDASTTDNQLDTASTTGTGGSCEVPAEVSNVEVNYPSCN